MRLATSGWYAALMHERAEMHTPHLVRPHTRLAAGHLGVKVTIVQAVVEYTQLHIGRSSCWEGGSAGSRECREASGGAGQGCQASCSGVKGPPSVSGEAIVSVEEGGERAGKR